MGGGGVARTDDDGWEITESVGATALGPDFLDAAPELMAGYDRRPSLDIEDSAPRTLLVMAQRRRREVTPK
jgi:hypothetical protein